MSLKIHCGEPIALCCGCQTGEQQANTPRGRHKGRLSTCTIRVRGRKDQEEVITAGQARFYVFAAIDRLRSADAVRFAMSNDAASRAEVAAPALCSDALPQIYR
jgi:hypothetical protein